MRSRRPMLLAFAASLAALTGILLAPAAGRFRGSFPVPHTAAWLALYRGRRERLRCYEQSHNCQGPVKAGPPAWPGRSDEASGRRGVW